MSDFITARTGAYRHHPDLKYEKAFTDGKGGTRTFTVLYAGARDAGIIGPEDNGIVVLDDDNLEVVLDCHMQTSSGYFGPNSEQMAEIKRIMGMNWMAFAEFCMNHPRYRGSVPDFTDNLPNYRYADPRDKEPLLDQATLAKFKDSPYEEAVGNPTLGEAKEYLRAHSFHKDSPYGKFRMSWNIKVGLFDTSGTADLEGLPVNRYLDDAWEGKVSDDNMMFYRACESGLYQYLEGQYATYPGDDMGRYQFATEGRSGGHLVLAAIDGHEYRFDGLSGLNEFFEDAGKEEIASLYILARHLDMDLARAKINQEMAYQYSSMRNNAEDSGDLYLTAEELARDEHEIGVLNFADTSVTIDLETGVLLAAPFDRPKALRSVGAVDLASTKPAGEGEVEPKGDALACFDFNKAPMTVPVEADADALRER